MTHINDSIDKMKLLNTELTDFFVERDEVCHTAVLSLASRQHHLQIGPPGTAKSALANAVCRAITNARIFDILMTRTMEPDALFGPLSLKGIEQDDFRRVTTDFIPECNILFLDEIYKSGDAVLNGLLSTLNERRIRNGRHMIDVPLTAMFCGSNELYEGPALLALHDRICFRHWVDYIVEKENFDKMLDNACSNGGGPHTENVGLTLTEIEDVQKEVLKVKVGREGKDCMWAIRQALKTEGFICTDRKAVWLTASVVRAEALLKGKDEVEQEDFEVLKDCLWNDPKDRMGVRSIILKIANPTGEEARQYIDSATSDYKSAMKFKEDNKDRNPREVQLKFLAANKEITMKGEALAKKVKEASGKSKKQFHDALKQVSIINDKVLAELQTTRIQ